LGHQYFGRRETPNI